MHRAKKRSSGENELADIQDELCFLQDLFETGVRGLNEPLSVCVVSALCVTPRSRLKRSGLAPSGCFSVLTLTCPDLRL